MATGVFVQCFASSRFLTRLDKLMQFHNANNLKKCIRSKVKIQQSVKNVLAQLIQAVNQMFQVNSCLNLFACVNYVNLNLFY